MAGNPNITVIAGRNGRPFAERLCKYMNIPVGEAECIRFSDGNSFVRIGETVRDKHVYLVAPIGVSPNDEFVEILFWLDAIKRASALAATVVMPYFGYAKGDKKDEPRVSIRARVCAESIELAGADHLITMDLHSPQVQGFFKMPLDHLSAMPLLVECARRLMSIENTVVISPDAGYAKSARKFADRLNCPVAIGDKTRRGHDERAETLEIIGEVRGKNALIVDDFTISGGTLANLAQELKHRGAEKIYAMLSHNVISQEGVEKIRNSAIEWVISTDTVENPNIKLCSKFKTLSVAPLFAESIIRFHECRSINELYDHLPDALYTACADMLEG